MHRTVGVLVEKRAEHDGVPVFAIRRSDNTPLGKNFRFSYAREVGRDAETHPGMYFRFDAIDYEIQSFLSLAIDGVDRIVQDLRTVA